MFLGCVLIPKEYYQKTKDILNNKQIRILKPSQVKEFLDSIRCMYKYKLKQIKPHDIDKNNKINLIDKGYVEIIKEIIKEVHSEKKYRIILDDYTIGRVMQDYSDTIIRAGTSFLIGNKADENYTACKVASLIARNARFIEVDSINIKYPLLLADGTILRPNSGSPANDNTKRYLIEYRKINPSSEFPHFVRKKWRNVMNIEKGCPKSTNYIFICCNHCNNSLKLVRIEFHSGSSKMYCNSCDNLIQSEHFRKQIKNQTIALDISTIISRMVSKDLRSTGYLKNNIFLIPYHL